MAQPRCCGSATARPRRPTQSQRTQDRMVLAGNRFTWLDFASAGTRANTPPVHNSAGNSHRTLTVTRKGGKVVTIPLAPRTARAIDLASGERTDGPVFLAGDRRRLDRHGAGRIVRKVARQAGIAKKVS